MQAQNQIPAFQTPWEIVADMEYTTLIWPTYQTILLVEKRGTKISAAAKIRP